MNKVQSIVHTSNPTKIKKIHNNKLNIELNEDFEGEKFFQMDEPKLGYLDLDKDSKIYVYVSAGSSEMRFTLGTLGNPKIPKNRLLVELPTELTFWFRLIVVDPIDSRILASAEKVRPKSSHEDTREPILPVETRDLGNILWKMNIQPDELPVLYLNKEFPNITDRFKTDKVFQILVLPQAVRMCLEHLIASDYDKNPDSWQYKWIVFLKELKMHTSLPHIDDDDIVKIKWLDKAINKFSKNVNLFDDAVSLTTNRGSKAGGFNE
jgi:hypothetical protein